MLDLDAFRLNLGFQIAPLRQRQILEDRPVGVAGDDGRPDASGWPLNHKRFSHVYS